MKECKFGSHRVIRPQGVLPQPALKVDPSLPITSNEILIDVETLNIDSASFTQIKDVCGNDASKMEAMILDIVKDRGKMQNPVTGSGGMLIGVVKEIGANFPDKSLKVGDKICTLVSLSLTPLVIDKINKVNVETDQVDIDGYAILFETGIYAVIPEDLPEKLVLAALDVAGAPAQVDKLVKSGDSVVIIGAAGKSGVLCTYQAKINAGDNGKVIGIVYNDAEASLLKELGFADEVIVADATDSIELYNKVLAANNSEQVDVTVNVVNVENTEMGSILITKDSGVVYFFSMATSFTKAALGAEGVGSDVTMIVGNGYTKGHALLTIDIVRKSEKIRDLYTNKYL
ncbi:MAG: L-erythro-3,5-diaminohexanoate dehydrogenase [Bacilli bacterium]